MIITKTPKTDIGKILEKLRVDYSETQPKQAERLEISTSHLSFLASGKRSFTYAMYKKVLECYDTRAYRDDIDIALIKKDVWQRFKDSCPEISNKEIIFILYGEYAE